MEGIALAFAFAHQNFNVLDLQKSIKFYEEALGLHVVREKKATDGSFILTFLTDDSGLFQLELTWLKDRTTPYDLGEAEFHLAFAADDLQSAHDLHEKMGCICYENKGMGIYFISDPDGYWLEIIPRR